MILMIDNYDSFTYNLVQYIGELGIEVKVARNDELTIDTIQVINPQVIVVSPGPCTPNEAGISLEVISHFAGKIPILGVCLGHQAIGQAFGGKVIRADRLMHGKVSPVFHNNEGVNADMPNPFRATRYHSLLVERESLPGCLEITAWTEEGEIMGLRHKKYAVEGVQYHPESIMTEEGKKIIRNFVETYSLTAKESR
ncbi:aminodeoxychorismate/anthranilate synthase component II [Psychrobacillus psychrodurans]|uniref:Aminodeoxychorismate/anthranilate synthase component II n=1 Tax=Psychrobacillus psychrodurans TaxID=126157 RepID=A0A9X3RCI8_9BACI|nr:aminodeoxychorismate/anthranilate synthase component II [Psychrobacillus psychrodurans]MCZ8535337.1 aminodeoxychorismate/anthranilate synthase component II [Psychrobacillus psychrodurans]